MRRFSPRTFLKIDKARVKERNDRGLSLPTPKLTAKLLEKHACEHAQGCNHLVQNALENSGNISDTGFAKGLLHGSPATSLLETTL